MNYFQEKYWAQAERGEIDATLVLCHGQIDNEKVAVVGTEALNALNYYIENNVYSFLVITRYRFNEKYDCLYEPPAFYKTMHKYFGESSFAMATGKSEKSKYWHTDHVQ